MKKITANKSVPADGANLAAEITADFERRREERRAYELQWRLNLNFLKGDQYCGVNDERGTLDGEEKSYYWQGRAVFNHLAPIYETRLAKLGRVRPSMGVMPAGAAAEDIQTARMSEKILNSAASRLDFSALIARAAMWSEACGTAFYKIAWNAGKGGILGNAGGKKVAEGEVEITICPPFEIYPDSQNAEDLSSVRSLIHARKASPSFIYETWGAEVAEDDGDGTLLIERYDAPSVSRPDGRLTICAGGSVLYDGILPYRNGTDGGRVFPFVQQKSVEIPGVFWGVSVLERSIPVQRAYNAVKNRKQEFLNRISAGVLAVEDGSCDTENLEEEGLNPGKVVVYRAGSNPPVMMDSGRLPAEFLAEEGRLLSEFIGISGVSEIMRNSSLPAGNLSGIALQLLIEQDDTRLSVTADLMRKCVRIAARHVLKLYKQFAATPRIGRIAGKDGVTEVFYWSRADINSEEIYFTSESNLTETPAQKRNLAFELLKAGVLHDENGRLGNEARLRLIEAFGFDWKF